MARIQTTVSLVGHTDAGKGKFNTATPQTANDVVAFKGTHGDTTFIITRLGPKKLLVATYRDGKCKGKYNMSKHPQCNYYRGTLNGYKVQVSLKKIVGELGGGGSKSTRRR